MNGNTLIANPPVATSPAEQPEKPREPIQAELDIQKDGFTKTLQETYEKVLGDGTKLVLKLYRGDKAGLAWVARIPDGYNENALQGILTAYGVEKVVSLLETALTSLQRLAAKGNTPEKPGKDWIAKMAVRNPILWGVEDVMKWTPEQTQESVASLTKEFTELKKLSKETTDKDKKTEYRKRGIEIAAKIHELQIRAMEAEDEEETTGSEE